MVEEEPTSATDVVERIEPLITSLPQQKKVELRHIIATSIQFQGPLPPPGMLEEYGRVIPDGANRLLILLEKQTDHRIEMESRLVQSRIDVTKRGQIIAAILSVFFGLVACILGYFGHDVLAGSIGVTTIIGLAVVFVLGKEPGKSTSKNSLDQPTKSAPPPSPKKRRSN